MPFVSVQFLIFLFLTAVLYFAAPKKWQWIVLLAASYIYFFINSEWLILVLFAQTLVTFGTGLLLEKQAEAEQAAVSALEESGSKDEIQAIRTSGGKKRKQTMICGVVIVLLALLFLKYYNFFAENISFLTRRFGIAFPKLDLLLPIGISFYTLQAIAYIVDIYHGKIHADTSLPKFMLFLSYFPQIVQGPIPRHKQLAHQLYESHNFDFQRFCLGFQLILWGFVKKMIIADRIAVPVSSIFDNPAEYEGAILYFAVAACYLQLYTDFSAGIDIARGFSQIIGIDLELNFTQPFFSASVKEFWHRWHMSLSKWLRDYIYIPLGGNRKGKFRQCVNILITFLISGIWHGSQWKYAAFGIWNGMIISVSFLLTNVFLRLKQLLKINEKLFSWKLFRILTTFLIISFNIFFIRGAGLKTSLSMIRSFFAAWYDLSFFTDGRLLKLGLEAAEWNLLAVMVLIMIIVSVLHEKGVSIREQIRAQGVVFEMLVVIISITAILILGAYGPGFDASRFIYQRF